MEADSMSTALVLRRVCSTLQSVYTAAIVYWHFFSGCCLCDWLFPRMTDQFLSWMHLFQQNPHSFQEQTLLELFQQYVFFCSITSVNFSVHTFSSLLIVVQPCGTDCIAVTKYEKEANKYVAKLKTRILCLLDPIRTQEYLALSNTGRLPCH